MVASTEKLKVRSGDGTTKSCQYTRLRELLRLQETTVLDDDVAFFTHFLQQALHGSSIYEERALKFWTRFKNETNSTDNLEFSELFPIDWNVPFPPSSNSQFRFIDLFAGIGGIRMAFQNVGAECVFSSEWDKFARKTYERNFGEVPFGDITQVDTKDIPDHDILLGGFPCQPFSIAGVSKKNALGRNHGFLDQTQGTLFFDIARIISEKRPKAFMLENVKNLVSHDKKRTFKVIESTLKELGYSVHYRVLDAKHYVPQHRERIIIVGFREDYSNASKAFEFPNAVSVPKSIKSILEAKVEPKYTLSDNLWSYLKNYKAKHRAKGNGFGFGIADLNGVSRTLSARYYKDGSEILIQQRGKNPRRLTPRECARLQGFPDHFEIPVSDNQAYKQFGNSVAVPLIQSVAQSIISALQSA
jgi:DNA (cytosine-5)-methyltransferase 1